MDQQRLDQIVKDFLCGKISRSVAKALIHFYVRLEELTMHYRNGREAKNGDKIVQIGGYGGDGAQVNAVGVLYDAKPGNDH